MNREIKYKGNIGESLANALLLRYFSIGTPRPDIGFDQTGELKEHLFEGINTPITFKFQTKTDKQFNVEISTLETWLKYIETHPVILLYVDVESLLKQKYYFIALHDWLHKNPKLNIKPNQKTKRFNIKDFELIEENGGNFEKIIRMEAERVLKKNTSPLRTNLQQNLPLIETDIFFNFGKLSRFELPNSLLDNLYDFGGIPNTLDSFRNLRQFWKFPDAHEAEISKIVGLKHYIENIYSPINEIDYQNEINEFISFTKTLQNFNKEGKFYFPVFSYDKIKCWRIFVQMYPESLNVLSCVVNNPKKFNNYQVYAAFLLLSSLADDSNTRYANKSIDVLIGVKHQYFTFSKTNDYNKFLATREYTFALAEATGDRKINKRHIEYVKKHPLDYDLRVNQEYYNDCTNDLLYISVQRKLKNPKPRDEKTKLISESIIDRIS